MKFFQSPMRRACLLALSFAVLMAAGQGVAFAGRRGLDDATRPDDASGSRGGSSSSGAQSSSSGSGSGGSSEGSHSSGNREGYDRMTSAGAPSAEELPEHKFETSLDAKTRNDRDQGDRFR